MAVIYLLPTSLYRQFRTANRLITIFKLKKMKATILIFIIASTLLLSCKDKKEEINRLNYQLQGVSDTLQLCQNARVWRLSRIDTLNNLIREKKTEIYSDSIDMVNYLSDHKMAVTCIAGGYVSANVKTDFETDYPQVVEDLASWGVILSIGYYLFNKDEVDEVVNKSTEADEKKKRLYAEINNHNQTLTEENYYLNDISNIETKYKLKFSEIEQKLETLR